MPNYLPEQISTAIKDSEKSLNDAPGKKVSPNTCQLQAFKEANKQDVNRILTQQNALTRKSKSNSISVEFGHIYADEAFTDEHAKTLIAGSSLSTILQAEGYQVSNVLFVDNYNPTNSSGFSLQDYLDFAAEHSSAHFDFVVYEAEMQSIACSIVDYLRSQSLTIHDTDSKLKLNGGSMLQENPDRFSCSLLDASFALLRMQLLQSSALNVLERKYKSQQRNVRSIISQINQQLADGLIQFYT